jgi:hypothetical protein
MPALMRVKAGANLQTNAVHPLLIEKLLGRACAELVRVGDWAGCITLLLAFP